MLDESIFQTLLRDHLEKAREKQRTGRTTRACQRVVNLLMETDKDAVVQWYVPGMAWVDKSIEPTMAKTLERDPRVTPETVEYFRKGPLRMVLFNHTRRIRVDLIFVTPSSNVRGIKFDSFVNDEAGTFDMLYADWLQSHIK